MYEERLKELSGKIDPEQKNLETYYVLAKKNKNREIYFRSSNESINFIEFKFNSFKDKKIYLHFKKTIYFLLKKNLLQPFLKKIKLSRRFGDVIFTGGKIISFDLNNKEVISFPLKNENKIKFLKSKKFQEKISRKNFAPKIYELDEKIPFSREELLEIRTDEDYYKIFKKLQKFHKFMGLEKMPIKKYISGLKRKLKNKNIDDGFIYQKLDKISKKNTDVVITTLHGDLAKENTLIKSGRILFTDLHPYKGLITNSIVNFIRGVEDLQSSKQFNKIISTYPKEVRKNIKIYLVLSEISLLEKRTISKKNTERKSKRIRNRKRRISKHLLH